MTLIRRPVVLVALLSVLIFGACVLWARPPFLADDYWWLWLPLNNPHFAWSEPYPFSRMPVSTLLTDALLKTGAWEAFPRLLMTLAFGVHAAAFALMLRTLLERAGLALNPRALIPFVAIALLFSFSPDNYEIHLWPILSVDSLAELLIAQAFRVESLPIAIALCTVALMFYDSFVFLLAGFAALLVAVTWFRDRTRARSLALRYAGLGVTAGIFWLLSKGILGWAVGFLHHPPIETSPLQALRNLKRVARTMWLIHFYKTNWVLTPLAWLAIIALCGTLIRRRWLPTGLLGLLLLIPLTSALPLCLNSYDAPRAFYGPQIVQALALAMLAFVLASHAGDRLRLRWPLFLLAAVFATQWGLILAIKRQNSKALERLSAQLRSRMERCQEPCVLTVIPPSEAVHKDYVLPGFVWTFYFDRLRLLYFPARKIRFEISDGKPGMPSSAPQGTLKFPIGPVHAEGMGS